MMGIDPVEEVATLEANAAEITETTVQREWKNGNAVLCFGNRRFFDKTLPKAPDRNTSPQYA